jgi:hypothetical protein
MAVTRIGSALVIMVGILIGLNTAVRSSNAADMRLVPKVSVREEYNSNLFLTADDDLEDYITILGAGLVFFARNERGQLDLSALVMPYFYREYDQLDETDADFAADAAYQLSSVTTLEIGGGLRLDHRSDRELESTGLVLGTDRRYRYHGSARTTWVATETDGVALSYDYDHDDWRDAEDTPPDFQGHTLGLDYVHDCGPRPRVTQLALNGGFGWYDYEDVRLESSFMTLGLQRRLTELLRFRIYGGARYRQTHQESERVPAAFAEEASWGGLGGARLEYVGERTRLGLTLSHDLRAAGGTQGPSNLTRAILTLSQRIQERFAIGITAGYFWNKAEPDEYFGNEIDQQTLNLRPTLRWQFLEHFALESAYAYIFSDNAVTGAEAHRHTVYLQLTFGYALLDYLDARVRPVRSEFSGAYPWSPLR